MLKNYLKEALSSVINNMPYPVWLKSTDGDYVLINKAYEDFYGIKLENLSVKDILFNLEQKGIIVEKITEDLENADNQVIIEKKAIVNDVNLKLRGKTHIVRITKSPVCGEGGEVIAILGLSKDITEEVNSSEKELKLAKDIQISSLPQIFPAFPDRTDFDIYGTLKAAKKVGGDFYDFYLLAQNILAFTIGDVSEKGVPAAMCMMKAKAALKNILLASSYISSDIMEKVNNMICSNNDDMMYITAGLGIVNLKTGDVIYFNAGHTHPIIKSHDGSIKQIVPPTNVALGLFEDRKFEPVSFKLNPGDTLFLHTDGVADAKNSEGVSFSKERIVDIVSNSDNNVKTIIDNICNEASKFVGDVVQEDDFTMLSFSYLGKENYLNKTIIPARISDLNQFHQWIEGCCSQCSIPQEQKSKIIMALEEIFVNLVYYAYPDVKKDNIQETAVYFKYLQPTKEVILTFIDSGIPNNPLLEEDSPLSNKIDEEKTVGGFSVAMVRNLTNALWYEYVNGKNVLHMKFSI